MVGKDASRAMAAYLFVGMRGRLSILGYMGRYAASCARDVADGQLTVAQPNHAIWASAEPVPNCEAMKLRTRVKST